MQPVTQDELLPASKVRGRYNVTDMTIYRWERDGRLNFPVPLWINRRRYWRLADLVAWESSKRSVDTKFAA